MLTIRHSFVSLYNLTQLAGKTPARQQASQSPYFKPNGKQRFI